MSSASVYRTGRRIVVCANTIDAASGVPVDAEPFMVYEEPAAASDVGAAVRRALESFSGDGLDSSGKDADHNARRVARNAAPADKAIDDFSEYLAQLLGHESYRALMRDARTCVVERHDAHIVARPVDPETGTDSVEADQPTLGVATAASHEAVGRHVLAALAKSR